MEEDIAHLEEPTLFVWGDKDRVASSAIGEYLARRMSDGHLTINRDAGHMPQLDQPEAAAAAVNSFLGASDRR